MTESRPKPSYQNIDGLRFAEFFTPNVVRRAISYKPKDNEFFVVTYPKCGTTWAIQIINLILTKGISDNNVMMVMKNSPYLELVGVEALEHMRKPGVIKMHLPYDIAPKSSRAKYLHVVRNPKDTLVSFYHHTTTLQYNFQDGSFDDYFEIFVNGENDYGDYFDHVLSWYEHRNDANVMLVNYEDLKSDTPKEVMKIAKFMGEDYAKMLENEPEVMRNVLKYSTMEHMMFMNALKRSDLSEEALEKLPPGIKNLFKKLSEANLPETFKFEFVRKGIVGAWREVFTEYQNHRMDEKIYARMKDTELYEFWKKVKCI